LQEKYKKVFITNLGKCTQIDARPLPDKVFKEYLELMEKEISIVNPKVIILFGNQVSSIVLNEKISVSQCRKKQFEKMEFIIGEANTVFENSDKRLIVL